MPSPRLDQATAALLAAVSLAADLGRLTLSFALPPLDDVDRAALDAILEAADGHDVPLAFHAERDINHLRRWIDALGSPLYRVGIDTASCLVNDMKIGQAITVDIGSLRLADATRDIDDQWQRCPLGEGDLDLATARILADLSPRHHQPVILDLGRFSGSVRSLQWAVHAWRAQTPKLP